MKNKNGFTLVELLAVIVLLGVVLTICILSVSSIQKSLKTKQRENVYSEIKIAASKYVKQTETKKVFVDTLIKEGYLEAENEKQEIYAPDTGEALNCYYVDYTTADAEVYNGDPDGDGVCNFDKISDAVIKMNYCVTYSSSCAGVTSYPLSSLETNNTWLKINESGGEKIILTITDGGTNIISGSTIAWISPLSPSDLVYQSQYRVTIPSTKAINDVYEVKVVKDGKTYSSSGRVKVDMKSPIIEDLTIQNAGNLSRTVSATLNDAESGLSKYAFVKDISNVGSVPSSQWNTGISGNKDTIEIATGDKFGTYYLWVMDKAGNVNLATKIELELIDTTPPQCVYEGENTEWTKNNVIITYGCVDVAGEGEGAVSGCTTEVVGSKTFNTTAQTGTIDSYVITDNAGNSTTCSSKTVNVYIDKKAPTVTSVKVKSSKTKYNASSFTATVAGSDAHSGVKYYCATLTNDSDDCGWSTSNSFALTAGTNGDGSTHTVYGFTKDKVGNISSVGSKKYTLYEECDEVIASNDPDFSECSAECGGGTASRIVDYEDAYFGTWCPSEEEEIYCNMHACCDEGEYEYVECTISGYKKYERYNECLDEWESYTSTKSCAGPDISCEWGDCESDGYKYNYCLYYKGGVAKNYAADYEKCEEPEPPAPSTPQVTPSSICSYKDNSEPLFGKGKGTIAGNYGDWHEGVYQYTCYANQTSCKRSNGYDRICITDLCGQYKGYTAKELSNAVAICKFSSYWCSCTKTGKF